MTCPDKLKGNGTKVYIDGTLYDAPDLVNLLKGKGVDPSSFDNVRLLVCHSGEGRSNAFARLFQKEIKKPVKAFEGTVSIAHGSTEMTHRRNIVRNEIQKTYPQATQSNVNQAADILVQDKFIGKITQHVEKLHGKKILINIALPDSPAHYQRTTISYRPRHFNR